MKKLLLAVVLLTSMSVNLNAGKFASFTKLCNEGNIFACTDLGFMYEKGKGVKQDLFKAVELYTKACDGGDALGCNNLVGMYYNGTGVKQSTLKAKDFSSKACEMGDATGCKNYAILNKK